jgi:hypothetical protein
VHDAEISTSRDGVDMVRFIRYVDLPDARVLLIQSIAPAEYRDTALETQNRMTGSLAFADADSTEACLLDPMDPPEPYTDIDGVTLATPGRAVPHGLALDGETFHYASAGQDGLTVRVGAWTVLEGDGRSTEERLAAFALVFAGEDGELVASTPTDVAGSPALDAEATFDGGASIVLSRVLELPDGRVLVLQTEAIASLRSQALEVHAALVASLVLVG